MLLIFPILQNPLLTLLTSVTTKSNFVSHVQNLSWLPFHSQKSQTPRGTYSQTAPPTFPSVLQSSWSDTPPPKNTHQPYFLRASYLLFPLTGMFSLKMSDGPFRLFTSLTKSHLYSEAFLSLPEQSCIATTSRFFLFLFLYLVLFYFLALITL